MSDLYSRLDSGQTSTDSRVHIKHFSVPYECSFHLVYVGFSAKAQFLHSSLSILLTRTTHVQTVNFLLNPLIKISLNFARIFIMSHVEYPQIAGRYQDSISI